MYFLKLYYKLLDWEWYTNANVMRLFIHCLLKANKKPKKWQGYTIERGSFITSYENLAFELGLTVQQIRTAINKLKSTGEITYQSTSQYSIITVKNWDEYQPDNTQNNKQITNEQQTNNKQITTTIECKNDKNDIVEINGFIREEKNEKKDPFVNPLIRFFKDEYFEIFNTRPYLTAIERNRLLELSTDIENFRETIPIVLEKMKAIDFGFDNWKPTSSWLLKENNYTAILNGTYDKQKKLSAFDELRERQKNGSS